MSFATSPTDCGPEARQQRFRPLIDVDLFTTWNAAGPRLREVLRLRGGRIPASSPAVQGKASTTRTTRSARLRQGASRDAVRSSQLRLLFITTVI
jgi:hypothetical protein